jgi:small subunit ribosomal protein S16
MVILRLKRGGKKRKPCYRVVAAERAMKRDGRNIEELGYYHPCSNPPEFKVNAEKVKQYLENGATMSPTVASWVKKQGIMG